MSDFTRILAALRARGTPVELAAASPGTADEDDLEDVSGYSISIEPDGSMEVFHCFSEPHTHHGEAQLGAAGLVDDGDDLGLTGVGLRAFEKRLLNELSEVLSRELSELPAAETS